MRRWRVVVIDDNPEGTLEAVLLTPLVVSQELPRDASDEQLLAAIENNLLNDYLPLEEGELYANEADVDFQLRDFATRRAECAPRCPIVEVERDFRRAWHLVSDLAQRPPDIVFLDIMFDPKLTDMADVEAIIDELQATERIAKAGRPGTREILVRGGLFLFGKLLRSRREVAAMPLVVLYSASREVQLDFLPFEYASEGRFEVIEKEALRAEPDRRQQVFRRRIRDYFEDGTVRPDDVRKSVEQLGTHEAIAGDKDVLVEAFGRDIGGGWCFGSMFVAEGVDYLSSEPKQRPRVVEELEAFVMPLLTHTRSLVNLFAASPARVFSHMPGTALTFSGRPAWLEEREGRDTAAGHFEVHTHMLNGRLGELRTLLQQALGRLPASLRTTLGSALDGKSPDAPTPACRLDALVASFSGYDDRWEKLLLQCRMKMPVYHISRHLAALAQTHNLDLVGDAEVSTKWDRAQKLELLLSPSEKEVKEPLASLLTAILAGMRDPAEAKKTVRVSYRIVDAPTALKIEIHDPTTTFLDLEHYDPHGTGGDLATSLVSAAAWFEVEILSGKVKRRPTVRGVGSSESSSVTTGTQFDIRIPAYRLEA